LHRGETTALQAPTACLWSDVPSILREDVRKARLILVHNRIKDLLANASSLCAADLIACTSYTWQRACLVQPIVVRIRVASCRIRIAIWIFFSTSVEIMLAHGSRKGALWVGCNQGVPQRQGGQGTRRRMLLCTVLQICVLETCTLDYQRRIP